MSGGRISWILCLDIRELVIKVLNSCGLYVIYVNGVRITFPQVCIF